MVPELAVAWSDVLPDRIIGLKAEGDRLSVLTYTSVLAEVQKEGKVAAQRVLEGAISRKAVEEMETASAPAELAAMQKKLGPQRLVKFVAKTGKDTAVVFWGGTVHVLDTPDE